MIIENDVGGLAPMALIIGEALISISLLVAGLVALVALLVFLIPPLEFLREMEGARLVVAPPRRFVLAIITVFAVGIIFVLIAGAFVVPLYPGTTTIRDAENHRLAAGLLFFLPGTVWLPTGAAGRRTIGRAAARHRLDTGQVYPGGIGQIAQRRRHHRFHRHLHGFHHGHGSLPGAEFGRFILEQCGHQGRHRHRCHLFDDLGRI